MMRTEVIRAAMVAGLTGLSFVPVRDIDVIFVGEPDPINPIGVKGIGEVAIVGVAPAIANAVFHATGRRIRSLPITAERLL
jgi:CO/xanthine dehydrogenase Mo-binding subunit